VPLLGELPIQQVGVEAVESDAAEWARMTSVNTANKTLTTLTGYFQAGAALRADSGEG
jgi:hypothetical protein